jgi:WD40 repeat protein
MIKALPKTAHANETKIGSKVVSSSQATPAMGVSALAWSSNGRFLAATEESYSRCLWIWDTTTAKLVELLVFMDAVTSFQWKQQSTTLLISCGTTSLYLWNTDDGIVKCEEVFPHTHVPFSIHSIKWNHEGDAVLLKGKESFTTCNVYVKK